MNRLLFTLLVAAVTIATVTMMVALGRGGGVDVSTSGDAGPREVMASSESRGATDAGPVREPARLGIDDTPAPDGSAAPSLDTRTVRRPGTLVRYVPEPGPPLRPATSVATMAGQGAGATSGIPVSGVLPVTGGRSRHQPTGSSDMRSPRHQDEALRHIPQERLPIESAGGTGRITEGPSPGSSPPARRKSSTTIPVGLLSGAGSPASPPADSASPDVPSPGSDSPAPAGQPTPPQPTHPSASSGRISIRLISDARSARSGETVRLDVLIHGARDVVDVPFALIYDTAHLEYAGSSEGTFLGMNGEPTVFAVSNDPAAGKISFGLSRYQRDLGVDGDGLLVRLKMKVRGEGVTSIGFDRGAVRDGQGAFLTADFIGVTLGG